MRLLLAASVAGAASVIVGVSTPVLAQDTAAESLAPITVQGGTAPEVERREREIRQTLDQVPGGTNLINLETKKGSQSTLAKVLDFEPGIIIQEFFGGNDQPRLNIRGSGIQDNPVSRGIQLLYDGLSVNQADGTFIIGLVDPEQAQFISVYRGANATRYGATTLGGAIDFSMRNARNSQSSVSVEAGSWGMRKGALALARQWGDWDLYLRASRYQSDGWRTHSEARRNNLALNLGFRSGAWENRSYLNYTDNRFEIPFLLTKQRAIDDPRSVIGDYATPGTKSTEDFLNVRTRDPWRHTEQFRLANKTTYYGRDATHTLGVYGETVRDRFKQPAWQADTRANNLGLDYAVDTTWQGSGWRQTQASLFVSANRGNMPRQYRLVSPDDGSLVRSFGDLGLMAENIVVGAQVVQDLVPKWQAVASLQYAYNKRNITDRNSPGLLDSRFKYTALNPKVGLIFSPSTSSRYYLNFSRSSEAPTFWQLADIGAGSVPASPGSLYLSVKPLKMQMANTFEIGTQQQSEFFTWEASYFYSRVKDELIAEVQNFAIDGTTVNYDHDSVHQGVELGFTGRTRTGLLSRTDWLTFRGIWNYSNFKFKGGRYDGNYIAGIPVHLITGELIYHVSDRFDVGLNVRWQPRDTDVDHYNAGLVQDKFMLLGARATWRPVKDWELFLDLHNITNRTYQTAYVVRGYSADDPASSLTAPTFVPGPGFHMAAGVSFRW